MPCVPKESKILVSGANGYLAMWVIRLLLEEGHSVRGTVRSEDKGLFLAEYFNKHGWGDKFEYVIVKDIAKVRFVGSIHDVQEADFGDIKEGAFDDAVKGVDAIEHTASPFHFNIGTSEGH